MSVRCFSGGVFGPPNPDILKFRPTREEFDELEEAMRVGDNLPNTVASLGAKVERRALLVGVQYEGDRRFTYGQSLLMLSAPTDVLMIYRMLLTRGYEPQNIRILMEGVIDDHLTHPKKKNIIDSLEWLFERAESGDYRYFHFSGHGYAYEVEERQGKKAKIRPVASTLMVHPDSSPLTDSDDSNWSAPGDRVKFYREGLLTEWHYPPFEEWAEIATKGTLGLIEGTMISDEELNDMIAKLPKGCVLTMTLNCFHGGQMCDIDHPFAGPWPRPRGGGLLFTEPEEEVEDQSITNLLKMYPNDSPRNLFVPPVFYLHSGIRFDPKVMMERVQGPNPLDGIQATVFAWCGYTTARTHAGAFISTFASVAQGLKGDTSHGGLFQEISQRVSEAAESEDGYPLLQLWVSGDGDNEKAEVLTNEQFVI